MIKIPSDVATKKISPSKAELLNNTYAHFSTDTESFTSSTPPMMPPRNNQSNSTSLPQSKRGMQQCTKPTAVNNLHPDNIYITYLPSTIKFAPYPTPRTITQSAKHLPTREHQYQIPSPKSKRQLTTNGTQTSRNAYLPVLWVFLLHVLGEGEAASETKVGSKYHERCREGKNEDV